MSSAIVEEVAVGLSGARWEPQVGQISAQNLDLDNFDAGCSEGNILTTVIVPEQGRMGI